MEILAQQAMAQGSESAGAARAAALARETATIDWRTVLADFLTSRTPDDFSWMTPNPRYVHLGLYLPSLARPTPGEIAFVIDTSGSVPGSVLQAVAAELGAFLESSPGSELTLLYVDAAVVGTQTVTLEDLPLKLEPLGRRGHLLCAGLRVLRAACRGTSRLPRLLHRLGRRLPRQSPAVPGPLARLRRRPPASSTIWHGRSPGLLTRLWPHPPVRLAGRG